MVFDENDHFHPDFDDPCLTVVIVFDLNDVAILAHAIVFKPLCCSRAGGGSLLCLVFLHPRQTCHGAQGIQIVRGPRPKSEKWPQVTNQEWFSAAWASGPLAFLKRSSRSSFTSTRPRGYVLLGAGLLRPVQANFVFFRFWPFWGLGLCCGCCVVLLLPKPCTPILGGLSRIHSFKRWWIITTERMDSGKLENWTCIGSHDQLSVR